MCNSLNVYNFEYKKMFLFRCKEGLICHGHYRLKKIIYVIKMTIIFQIMYKTVNVKNLSFQLKVGRIMIPYPSESVAPYHKWQPYVCNSLNFTTLNIEMFLFWCKGVFICLRHDRSETIT